MTRGRALDAPTTIRVALHATGAARAALRATSRLAPVRATGTAVLLAALVLAGCMARPGRPDLADRAGRMGPDLVRYAADACREQRGGASLPPYAFTTDGCSMWKDGQWVACCVEHDERYWCGGNAAAREDADALLRACVRGDDARPHLGDLMYWGVRAGGIPWQPFPWRWGYGYPGVRGYDGRGRGCATAAPAREP